MTSAAPPGGSLPHGSNAVSRPRAQEVAWNWAPTRPRDVDATAARAAAMRRKGAVQGVVGLAIAGGLYALGHPTVAIIAASIASLTLVLAMVSPLGAFAAIEKVMRGFGVWVGRVVTVVVMLPIFAFFFVPFGLLFRRGAKDPMQRAVDTAASSYWRVREDQLGGERHEAQF